MQESSSSASMQKPSVSGLAGHDYLRVAGWCHGGESQKTHIEIISIIIYDRILYNGLEKECPH